MTRYRNNEGPLCKQNLFRNKSHANKVLIVKACYIYYVGVSFVALTYFVTPVNMWRKIKVSFFLMIRRCITTHHNLRYMNEIKEQFILLRDI